MAIPFLNNIDLNNNQLINAKLYVTSVPPSPEKGMVYFDETDNTAKYYDGTQWLSLSSFFPNLTYTASSTDGTVVISGGGTSATIPLANNTNAGLLSPTEKQQIASAVQPDDISGLVPYTGATSNVNLGEFGIEPNYILFPSTETESPIPNQKGLLYYNTTKDVLVFQDAEAGTSVEIGQELLVRCRNNTGSTIVDGSVVYISGAIGQNPTIALAQANTLTSSRLIGVVTHDIANNSLGKVCVFGTVNNINTSAFNDGDEVYLSSSVAGGLTLTPPSDFVTYIGVIEHAHPTQGKLLVRPQKTLGNSNSLGTSQIIPPTQNAVKTYVDNGLATKQNTLTNPITGTGANGQVAFFNDTNTQTSDAVFVWDNTNKRLGVGSADTPQARLDVRAQGALFTDVAFRVRNSANTINFLQVLGNGSVFSRANNTSNTVTIFGESAALASTGLNNTIFGSIAGRDLTTGINNTIFGNAGGTLLTTHSANSFFGRGAGQNATGNSNSYFGAAAAGNLVGANNAVFGQIAGLNITTGNNLVIFGSNAAILIENGSNLTSAENSLFFGFGTRAQGNSQTNQIVIGHNAIGLGSNSVVLGNSSITQTQLRGNVICGNQTALATNATTGFLYIPTCAGVPTGTPTAITGKAPMVADTTNNRLYIYLGGAWVAMN